MLSHCNRDVFEHNAGIEMPTMPQEENDLVSSCVVSLLQETLANAWISNTVAECEKQLSETALRSSIVTEDGLERAITQGLRKALSKRFTSTDVIAQSVKKEDQKRI